jgi:hypothetical protein
LQNKIITSCQMDSFFIPRLTSTLASKWPATEKAIGNKNR